MASCTWASSRPRIAATREAKLGTAGVSSVPSSWAMTAPAVKTLMTIMVAATGISNLFFIIYRTYAVEELVLILKPKLIPNE
jgi:hypothetical protein